MERLVTAKSFEEYWEATVLNRRGYPAEVVDLLRRHEWAAWYSAIKSAANNAYFAMGEFEIESHMVLVSGSDPVGVAKVVLDTIRGMLGDEQPGRWPEG